MNLKSLFIFMVTATLFSSCHKEFFNSNDLATKARTVSSTQELTYNEFKTYAYAYADFTDSTTEYTIEYKELVVSAAIRPYSKNIPVSVSGNSISFSLPQAGNYVAYINGFKIIIFAQAPEVVPTGPNVKNIVSDFGCDSTGTVNETVTIQTAIQNVAGTGKTLLFPKGKYLTSRLKIQNISGLNIYLERGAVIIADTSDLNSYATNDVFGAPGPSSVIGRDKWVAAPTFILIDQSSNINISGQGMINGQGRASRRNAVVQYGNESKGRYRNFLITRSNDVNLTGIISADPGVWNTHILKSEDVTCENVKVMNEIDYAPIPGNLNNIDHDRLSTDGFDLDASKNVLINNCFAYCGDDNIAVKTSEYAGLLDDVDGITVSNCVFLTQKSSLKVGTETGGAEMKNILFQNNDVLQADRGIALYCYDGAEIESVWSNNRIEGNYPDAKKSAIFLEIKPRVTGSLIGKASVTISNTTVLNAFPNKSEVRYNNPASPDGTTEMIVDINNLTIGGVNVTNTNNATYFKYAGSPSVSF